jgi:predicted house-cleaning noncanonical NTP pyrophosphatase (MazG superfamily)
MADNTSQPYNKLVRNKTPQIIEHDGNQAVYHILASDEYTTEAGKKFGQQGQDYASAPDKEERLRELSDILQLVHDTAKREDATIEDIEAIRVEKHEQRGGFGDGIYLESIIEGKAA